MSIHVLYIALQVVSSYVLYTVHFTLYRLSQVMYCTLYTAQEVLSYILYT